MPQLPPAHVRVEESDHVKVQRRHHALGAVPEVRLRAVLVEEARKEGLHVGEEALHLRLVQQVVVGRQVDVVGRRVRVGLVDELSKRHIPPEQVLRGFEVLALGAAELHVDGDVPEALLQLLGGPLGQRAPLAGQVLDDHGPADVEVVLQLLRGDGLQPRHAPHELTFLQVGVPELAGAAPVFVKERKLAHLGREHARLVAAPAAQHRRHQRHRVGGLHGCGKLGGA
mmetsp:Transcript_12717/g.24127  ORF Transcript_12717/g.24127 Transcript_12717/m.24127 type:complete len:227 (+) Transcript_12717:1121-1801(+)